MTDKTYSTRNEAIQREIIDALGEFADDFDVDAIATEVIDSRMAGANPEFFCTVDGSEFWTIVEKHASPQGGQP